MSLADFPPVPATVEEARAPFACARLSARVQSARGCVAAFVAASAPGTVEDGARVVDRRRLCRGCPSGAARLALLGDEPAPRAPVRRRPADRTEDGQPDAEVRRVRNGVRARAAAQAERAIRAAADRKNARRAQARALERAGYALLTPPALGPGSGISIVGPWTDVDEGVARALRTTPTTVDAQLAEDVRSETARFARDVAPDKTSRAETAPGWAQEVRIMEDHEIIQLLPDDFGVATREPQPELRPRSPAARLAAAATELDDIDRGLASIDERIAALHGERAVLLDRRAEALTDVEAAVAALRGGA